MLLILESVILLESVMFGIFIPDHRKKSRLFLSGAFIAVLLILASVMHNNALIWGLFIVGHIILLNIYLISYYNLTNQIEKQDLKTLLREYVKIPTYLYLLLILAVLYALLEKTASDDLLSVALILIIAFAAGIYNFVENKTINKLSDEQIKKMELQELRQYIYRKDALAGVYSIIFSISIGTLYICMLHDSKNENIVVLIFILELIINMTIYKICYHKVKVKFMDDDEYQYQYPKWQLIVPKRVGIGVTFNFECPFTYIILGIVIVVVIISLL